ncbi:C-type lectin domain-containing protein [uncultured Chryseobacterium sp.]|uniref:C-type lectin domain-containing protein n=1 Tax=uncultured Chryseobacterium sp. TaxID=259322 RepID=UPI0025CD8D2D|nr:C-type lectin domain-containing protein [uncultured Chryseobacterium sp.]
MVDPNILGYTPSTVATATTHAPATKTTGGAMATRQTIGSYSGHKYTSYTTNTSVTWYEAYAAAKDMGGYLATFTTDSEWQYVEQNVINGAAFNTNSGWIGFAKFSWFAGSALTPDHEMKWITGE